jgi:hypothetical protein
LYHKRREITGNRSVEGTYQPVVRRERSFRGRAGRREEGGERKKGRYGRGGRKEEGGKGREGMPRFSAQNIYMIGL